MDPFLDFSPIFIGSCENYRGSVDKYMKLMKNIDGSKRFIGFENSNKFTEKIRT
jgi:hypothetical protein